MSLKTDTEAAFDAAAQVDAGALVLGDRAPCECLLPEGLPTVTERRRSSARVRVLAKVEDIVERPQVAEVASVEYGAETHALAVDSDDVGLIGQAIFEFTLSG